MNANEDQDLKTARENVKIMFNDEGLNAINAGFCYIFAPFRAFIGDKDFVKIIREFKQKNSNNIINIDNIVNNRVKDCDQAKKVKILIEAILNNTDENGQLFSNKPTSYYSQLGYKTRFINLIAKLYLLGENDFRYDNPVVIEKLLTLVSDALTNGKQLVKQKDTQYIFTQEQLKKNYESMIDSVNKESKNKEEDLKTVNKQQQEKREERQTKLNEIEGLLKEGKVLRISGDNAYDKQTSHIYNIAKIDKTFIVLGLGWRYEFNNLEKALGCGSNFNIPSTMLGITWTETKNIGLSNTQQINSVPIATNKAFQLNQTNNINIIRQAEKQNLFSQSINNNKIIAQKGPYPVPVQNTNNIFQNNYPVLKKVNNTMPNNIIAQSSNVVNLKSFNPNNLNNTQGQANKIPNPQTFSQPIVKYNNQPNIKAKTARKRLIIPAIQATNITGILSYKNNLQNYQPAQAYQTTITPQIKTVPIIQTHVIPIKTADALTSKMTTMTANKTANKYSSPNTFLFGQNYQKRPQIYNVHMQKQNITIPRIPKTTYTPQNNTINQQSNQPRPLTTQTTIQQTPIINSGPITTFTNTTPNNDAWINWALRNDNGPCPDKPGEFTVRGDIHEKDNDEYTKFLFGPVKNLYAKYYPGYIPPNWVNGQQYNQ